MDTATAVQIAPSAYGAAPGLEPIPKFKEHKLAAIRSYMGFLRTGEMPSYPLEVYLEISNACDLKCAMCGPFSALSDARKRALGRDKRGFMSADSLAEPLDEVLKHAIEVHCFGYGEPTINPAFPTFIEMVSPYEVNIDFFSNGMHLTDSMVRLLVDSGVSQITISFSGATKEDYENVYIGGNFERVLGGIKALSDYKKEKGTSFPYIVINSLAYKHHVEKLERFVELMGRNGANSIMLGPIFQTNVVELDTHASIYRPWVEGQTLARAKEIGATLGVGVYSGHYESTAVTSEEQYERRIKKQFARLDEAGISHVPVEQLKAYARTIKQSSSVAPEHIERSNSRSLDMMALDRGDVRALSDFVAAAELDKDGIFCFEPFKTMFVTTNLDAKPCCNAVVLPPAAPLGSLRRNSAKEIWDGAPMDLLRRGIAAGQYPSMCHGCMKRKNAYTNHGLAEKVGRYVGWFEGMFKVPFEVDVQGTLSALDEKKLWPAVVAGGEF